MNMEEDGINIRELRQEEASEARDIVVSGLKKQIVTYRSALKVFFRRIGWVIMGLCLVGFYLLTSSLCLLSWQQCLFVSVVLATVYRIHVCLGVVYSKFREYINSEPDLRDLYPWYKDGGKFWVAVWRGKIVGTVGLQRTSATVAELKRMSVVPSCRRKGLATCMVKHFEEHCRSNGIERITLLTSAFQPEAKCLYQKCGFTITKNFENGSIRFEKSI